MSSNERTQEYPVAVIAEHRGATNQMEIVAVVAGGAHAAPGRQGRLVREARGTEQFVWTGFTVRLHRDSTESYWRNLTGEHPSLFVICHANESGGIAPFAVTADYDDAGAHMEADDVVFAVPMPKEIYLEMEHYVVEYHKPPEIKKRKREKWA